jgi:serine/threonine protein kinase
MTAPRLGPGTVVAGKYSIGACLGLTGCAGTYRATMGALGGREVVIKLYDPAIRQRSDMMSQLELVYAGMNALPQDVVAPILDAGYDASTGAPYSVTELVTYPSLAQFVAQRALTPEETSQLLKLVGRAIDAAHGRNLLHHALRPTNVFVAAGGAFGVKVTDFGAGLARTAAPAQDASALAAPWLAPEQAQNRRAGPGADVFAAALLAFYALTGRSYWLACQGATIDYAGWQRELLSPRTPPSARALQLGVSLDSAFDSVIGRALMLDPRERFPSVGELAMALEGIINARAPDSAATMAFPMGMLGVNQADYPPPPPPASPTPAPMPLHAPPQRMPAPVASGPGYAVPQPMASNPGLPPPGYQAPPPGYTPGLPQQQQQALQQQPPQQQQAAPPQYTPPPPLVSTPAPGGYAPTGPASAPRVREPSAALATQLAARPGEYGLPRAPTSTRIVPILVGIIAVLLLGGAAAAFVVMGKKPSGGPVTAQSGATTTTSTPVTTDAPSATAAADVPSATPVATSNATAAEDAGAPPADTGELVVTCEPTCDEVKVDDLALGDGSQTASLPPGKHKLTMSKEGFATINDNVTIAIGKRVEKKYKLAAKVSGNGTGNAPPPGTGTPKNDKKCGQFLKRCPPK